MAGEEELDSESLVTVWLCLSVHDVPDRLYYMLGIPASEWFVWFSTITEGAIGSWGKSQWLRQYLETEPLSLTCKVFA